MADPYTDILNKVATSLGVSQEIAIVLVSIILIWTLIWKGLALWKSAKKDQPTWFVILLLVNTIGILEILYIYVFSEMKFQDKNQKIPKSTKKVKKRR